MSIRFPDLQVLFPRAADAPKAAPQAEQANQANLHAQGLRIAQEKEEKNTSVAHADQAEHTAIRERRRDEGRPRKRKRRPSDGDGKGDGQGRGKHLDIEA